MAALLGFSVCAAGMLYILAGYPLAAAALARWRPRAIRREFKARPVTVVLAVRNGEKWIRRKLQSILALDYPRELLQVIVVSDGSDDGTEGAALEFAPRGVEIVRVARGGKAQALNAGVERARGEIVLFTDVRQELAPDSLRRLVACLGDPAVGVASGELVIRDGATREQANVGLYWRYEKWIRRSLSRIDSVIGATGCLYAMRRELIAPMPAGTLLDDVHLPLAAFFRGYRVVLESGALAFDEPASLRSEFFRKVRTQAGVVQLIGQYPALLTTGNRMLGHFVSHKLGRLLLPYLLIGMGVTSFGLASPWREAAVAGQAALYALALVDRWIPDGVALKRLTSPAGTFVAMMAAALLAMSVLFVPGGTLWRESGGAKAQGKAAAAGDD